MRFSEQFFVCWSLQVIAAGNIDHMYLRQVLINRKNNRGTGHPAHDLTPVNLPCRDLVKIHMQNKMFPALF